MRNNIDKKLVAELNENYTKIVDIAKEYARIKDEEYTDSLRRNISNHVAKLSDKETDEQTSVTNQYVRDEVLSARKADGTLMTVEEFCNFYGIPFEDVKSYKLVTHTGTPYYNIASRLIDSDDAFDLNSLVDKFKDTLSNLDKIHINIPKKESGDKVLKIVFTDLHIGAEVSDEEKSLFDASWTKEDIFSTRDIMLSNIKSVIGNNKFFKIIVEDLGDLVDGWDGLTTRGGHKLPQNMTNEQMFDNAVTFKTSLISSILMLTEYQTPLELHSVCNDNHGGAFTYIVNSAVKLYLESKFSNVTCINHRKFIDHYFVGNHVFILSHGKDDKHMKFGFSVPVNQKGIDKIQEYMKLNNLYSRGYYVSFNKGDTHVQQLDDSCSDDFSYNSYMALSPATQWVQHNFKRGRRGFNIQIFDEKSRGIQNIPIYIEYAK